MVYEMLQKAKANHKPVYGEFPKKPSTSKSLHKWLEEDKIPVDFESAKCYQMAGGVMGYYYYDKDDVRDMSPEELKELDIMLHDGSFRIKTSSGNSSTGKTQKTSNSKYLAIANRIPANIRDRGVFAFDVETTGFSDVYDDLLQLSIVGTYNLEYDTYLKPMQKKRWDKAEVVNHISPAMVENAPSPHQIRDMIVKWFVKADFVVGHNVKFDVRFMNAKFRMNIDESKIIDTMDLFKYLQPDAPNNKLETVVQYYGSEEIKQEYAAGAHNSLFDTRATFQCFLAMCDEIIAKRANMVDSNSENAGLTCD